MEKEICFNCGKTLILGKCKCGGLTPIRKLIRGYNPKNKNIYKV
jgi:hypothetical protein